MIMRQSSIRMCIEEVMHEKNVRHRRFPKPDPAIMFLINFNARQIETYSENMVDLICLIC